MNVILNNIPTELPTGCLTVSDLLKWKDVNSQSTAVAINDKVIRKYMWETTCLSPSDRITIISMAFGG